ncbi:MAG: NAD-dependent epimerase/dehydratase family protein [Deltaproteobacteria bacterium]|nr:NAD-dependent epimerase/dehydratase family protein [Deltaproteobacteria bacterium]
MIENKRIFITGGAGFIGSTVAGRLLDSNHVWIYDNLDRDSLKDREFAGHDHLELIVGDVLDRESLRKAIARVRPTHIIHCAAIAGIDTVIRKPVKTMQVNLTGTGNLFLSLTDMDGLRDIERVVIFSTSEVFGSHAFMSGEQDKAVIGTVGEARWTYAVSKLASEHLALAYFKERKMPVVVLRPFNVYGPGQIGEGALSIFIKQAIQGRDLDIHGNGTQIRAWCYIDDMIRGLLMALEHPKAVGETFNIGNQRAVTTIYGLANTVVRVLGSSSKIKFVTWDHADIELRVPDVSKARDLLGFEAKVGLDEGIEMTAGYLKGLLASHGGGGR